MGSCCFASALWLFSHPLNRPLLLAQRTAIALLHPKGHAAVVKRMIALSPDDDAVLPAVEVLLAFRLTSETGVHHLNSANRAGVTLHVPAPHGHRVPFLQDKHLIRLHVVVVTAISGILLGLGHPDVRSSL